MASKTKTRTDPQVQWDDGEDQLTTGGKQLSQNSFQNHLRRIPPPKARSMISEWFREP